MTTPYHPPVKRSLAIAGHKTSISLEPLFWTLLRAAAAREGVSLAQLVARIDAERITADPAPGLAGAVRLWLVSHGGGGKPFPADAMEKGGEVTHAAPAEGPASGNQ